MSLPSRPLFITTVVILFLCIGCKKESGPPPRESFTVSYRFVNEGDPNLQHLFLRTSTFYPNYVADNRGDSLDDYDGWDQTFNDIGLNGFVVSTMRKKGYTGCSTTMKFVVRLKNTVYSPVYAAKGYGGDNGVYPVGMTKARAYIGVAKVISTPADSVYIFKWPSDTAYYQEVLYY